MPSGIEIMLAFPNHNKEWQEKLTKVLEELNIPHPSSLSESEGDSYDKFDKSLNTYNDILSKVHELCLLDAGFTPSQKKDRNNNKDYPVYHTPLGVRQFSKFSLEWSQEGEFDETIEQGVFGIAISGRYFPTFLDWKDSHGTLTPMIFDDELLKMMEIAKKRIIEAIPQFKEAVWVVKEKWY